MMMKKVKIILPVAIILIFILLSATPVLGSWDSIVENEVYIREGEEFEGDLWVIGRSVEIKGRVKGDLLIFAEELKVSGQIDGDLLGMVGRTEITGNLQGNLRLLSMVTRINGLVAGNISAAGTELLIEPEATVSTLWGWYNLANISGEIRESAVVNGNIFNLTGKVGEDLKIGVNKGFIAESALIGGDFYYPAGITPIIESGTKIGGKISEYELASSSGLPVFKGLWFLGGLFFGVIWLLISPRGWMEMTELSSISWRRLILLGVGGVFLLPLLSIFFSALLIGLPLGICLLILFFILLLYGELPSYLLMGKLLYRLLWKNKKIHPVFLFISGGFVLAFLKWLPYIGFIITILSKVLGYGLLLSYLFRKKQVKKIEVTI
jgi:cytoskeletal protein CcmA (bactofilin family)